ncbi:hypothetical protein P167DRAFT_577019 [Morchella conica CCBAS932]|uniref:C2H2-type domain-containing protein n=2 Tax=Morchella sect. Distantes TaxID=1051054 RepID=A0A3N4KGW0_9PEZI|nr:hypothetical protein P167DRAFT_577019 [Morchella conica CCBAS932]
MVTLPSDGSLSMTASASSTGSHSDVEMLSPTLSAPTTPQSTLDTEEHVQSRTYFAPPPANLNNRRKPYPCNVPNCSRSYMTLRNLQFHHHYHPSSFLCRFDGCEGAFVSLIDRTVHEIDYHGKTKQLQCYLCSYNSLSRDAIRGHIKRQHPEVDLQIAMSWIVHGEGPGGDDGAHRRMVGRTKDKSLWLVCPLCGMQTEREANMYQHLWRNHKDEKNSRMPLLEKIKNEREERVKKAEREAGKIKKGSEEDEGEVKVKIEGQEEEEGIMDLD